MQYPLMFMPFTPLLIRRLKKYFLKQRKMFSKNRKSEITGIGRRMMTWRWRWTSYKQTFGKAWLYWITEIGKFYWICRFLVIWYKYRMLRNITQKLISWREKKYTIKSMFKVSEANILLVPFFYYMSISKLKYDYKYLLYWRIWGIWLGSSITGGTLGISFGEK